MRRGRGRISRKLQKQSDNRYRGRVRPQSVDYYAVGRRACPNYRRKRLYPALGDLPVCEQPPNARQCRTIYRPHRRARIETRNQTVARPYIRRRRPRLLRGFIRRPLPFKEETKLINSAMFTSNTNEWATPQAFFDELNKEFAFTLDPCATPENAKCARFFTKEIDGLAQSWRGETVFCNPPYGRDLAKWVAKAHAEVSAGGVQRLLCLFPPVRIRRIFTTIFTKNTRYGLSAGGCTSTKAKTPRRFRQWLLSCVRQTRTDREAQ